MSLIREWKQSAKLLQQKHKFVFFAEGGNYFAYYTYLVRALTEQGASVVYITADENDPLLHRQQKGLQVYCFRYLLISVLNRLKAEYVFMTMTELGHHAFQKSKNVRRYVYVFHALVSLHQQYKKGAFNAYDVFLSPGVLFDGEIKNIMPAAGILPYGYPILSAVAANIENQQKPVRKILLAPSWHEGCIFNTCFETLITALIKGDMQVSVRFHPEYRKRYYRRWKQIQMIIKKNSFLILDTEPDVIRSLKEHELLITDRSGIAFEFALGKAVPVIYIDTEKKQMNTEAASQRAAIEDVYRQHTGISVAPEAVQSVPQVIQKIIANEADWRQQLQALKQELVYNEKEMLPQLIAALLNNEV
jgi:hypothetical protein